MKHFILIVMTGWLLLLWSDSAFARPFKNAQGKVIAAEMKSVSGGNVTIVRDSDGKEFTIPVTSLSVDDQKFIQEWAAEKAPKPMAESAVEPAEEVKAGAQFKMDFPDLGPDRRGEPAQVGVKIPANYDPTKPIPLFVWMSGGDGANGATTSGLVDGGRFVTVGLPFPKGANNPGQGNMVGDFKTIWKDYHQPMLTELFERIPNLDKRLCIIGGFSNGAHCLAGVLQEAPNGGYAEFFNCYVLVDGGSGGKRLKGGRGSYLFATWGETSLNAGNTASAARKASGMEVETFEMADTGHKFADSGKEKVKAWLDDVVIPATLGAGE